eukprot:CAMPEP_0175065696 /NCGR_PEP_ID=MMETSP0052_2-20121109/16081_1 /TAXON_ID=51329 ORGANISM="Polytomella parva, Strain SAG 63-3" /NCGR_SAMPLE_ID=MMETSP0052_2 /ASSEMBLY_ACC=CAM_ASM_000194 /LENGTH=235 /DNA_ID=CAMNT_0016332285 /DNA_START=21 /DNA_END=724 /DNA_ORIENTATION=-
MSDSEVLILEEARKKPIDERVTHSNWKARSEAYEHIRDSCNRVFDESDSCLSTFAGFFAKAVVDSNAAAQDKAVEALSAFLQKCPDTLASRIVDKTCAGLVNKCLTGRPSTSQRAYECLLLFIEVEQAERVLEQLIIGFDNKVPKVVVAALDGVFYCIRLFGVKVVDFKILLRSFPKLFESKDNKARDKAKEVIVELSRWVGADVIKAALFDKMRDAIRDDIDRAMQEAAAAAGG